MKTRLRFLAVLILTAFNACTGTFKQDDSGVTVKVQSPALGQNPGW